MSASTTMFSLVVSCIILAMLKTAEGQQLYSCNGQVASYPLPGCTYGNTGLYGNNLYGGGLYGGSGLYGSNPYGSGLYGSNPYGSGLYGNNLYGSGLSGIGSQVQYLCNGVLTPYPNPACTYSSSSTSSTGTITLSGTSTSGALYTGTLSSVGNK